METLRYVLLFHFASGQAYFSGAAIMLAAIGLSPWVRSRWPRSIRMGAVILAAALAGLSAVPAPWIVCIALAAATIGWLACERLDRDQPTRRLMIWRYATAFVWTLAVLIELPHHFAPTLPRPVDASLEVLGDSVTAGAGEPGVVRWPQLLATEHVIAVADHSQMGATAASALKQAEQLRSGQSLVLIEIGGNDLLGTTTPADFERHLRRLLAKVCQPGRSVVMFELPLPPFYNRWGMIQRRVADEFGVPLIPRRVLAGVLLTGGNTSDAVHLTQAGHTAMAKAVWRVVDASLDASR